MVSLKKRTTAMTLAAVLILSLLLSACGNDSGNAPTEGSTTPETSSAPAESAPASTTESGSTIAGGDVVPERVERPNLDVAEKPSYTQANVYGNTSGNIGNRGYAAIQGDWIYYHNANHDMLLYAMKTDGSCNQKLSNDVPLFINVVGDWVYYIDALTIQGSDKIIHQIYKVNIDGSGRQLVCDDSAGYINVVGDDIYYCNESDGFTVYTIKTDGTGRKKLTDDPALSVAVSDGWIYFSDNVNLCAVKTDGTEQKTLASQSVPLINAAGDKIYYTGLIDHMETICVVNTDGSGKETLYYHNAAFFNVSGGKIFYSEYKGGDFANDGFVASMNTDTSGLQELGSQPQAQYLNVVGDWIVYASSADGKLYMIKTDGIENRLAGGPPDTDMDGLVIPQAGTVSVADTYYRSEQMVYGLPEGLEFYGAFGSGEAYITTWAKNLNLYSAIPADEIVQIQEYSDKIAGFETRTAEEWCVFGTAYTTVPPGISDLKMEKTTVDGCPAVRVTYMFTQNDVTQYNESWIIDAPKGGIVFAFAQDGGVCEDAEQLSQWAAIAISAILIDQ